jgi:hypothetical protein
MPQADSSVQPSTITKDFACIAVLQEKAEC